MSGRLLDAARTARAAAEVKGALQDHRALYLDPAAPPAGEDQLRSAARYYDLVTDFYEYGWGQSFHFGVRHPGNTLQQAIEQHEAWVGQEAGLCAGVRALDLGCGVGGPMRFLAQTTGAHVTGVNVNRTQVVRAQARAQAQGLGERITVIEADFAELPFPDASFDAVYAIEATCHAADRPRVFAEAARVLRPGGRFVGYEWCTTGPFDPSNESHLQVTRAIEEGNALPPLLSTRAIDEALQDSSFVLREGRDVALDCDPETPWYMALNGEGGLRALPRTPWGRAITGVLVRMLEGVRLAPAGATEVSNLLNQAADALVAGGRLGIFTPMYRFSAEKPTGPPALEE